MRIKGNTIIFKSLPELYEVERDGTKPNTIRRVSEAEAKDINSDLQIIKIYNSTNPKQYFKKRLIDSRDVTNALNIRFYNDDRLFVFSWRHV